MDKNYYICEYFGDYQIDSQKYYDTAFNSFDDAMRAAKEVFADKVNRVPKIKKGSVPVEWGERSTYYIEIYLAKSPDDIDAKTAIKYLY